MTDARDVSRIVIGISKSFRPQKSPFKELASSSTLYGFLFYQFRSSLLR